MAINQKKLMEDIELYLRTFAYSYCKAGEKNITRMAQNAMDRFYEDYTPDYYVRTKNLKRRSYQPYFHDNGSTMYGGVKISSEKMHDNYNDPPEYVVDAAWHGWHGKNPYNDVANWYYQTRSPIAIVQREMNNKNFLKDVTNQAAKDAINKEYSVISMFIK